MPVLRTHIHRGISLIFFFITGFGTFPAYHGITLGSKESSGLRRETETGLFVVYNDTSPLALFRQCIAESHIIVAHAECHVHLLPLRISKGTYQFIGTVVYTGGFDARLSINGINLSLFMPGQLHCFREVPHIGLQSQGRGFEHLLAVIGERIRGFSSFRTRNGQLQLTVRSTDGYILCCQR